MKKPVAATTEAGLVMRGRKLVHGHHHVLSLDDGVSFVADGKTQGLRGWRRDGGNDLFTGRGRIDF